MYQYIYTIYIYTLRINNVRIFGHGNEAKLWTAVAQFRAFCAPFNFSSAVCGEWENNVARLGIFRGEILPEGLEDGTEGFKVSILLRDLRDFSSAVCAALEEQHWEKNWEKQQLCVSASLAPNLHLFFQTTTVIW